MGFHTCLSQTPQGRDLMGRKPIIKGNIADSEMKQINASNLNLDILIFSQI